MKRKYLVMAAAATLAAGCANTNISKEMQGTMGGAAAGAIAGAQVGGVRGAIIGGIVGGVIGNRIGAYLDDEDKKKLAQLEEQALQTGKGASFVSHKSKGKVTVTPQKSVVEADPDRTLTLPSDVARQNLEVATGDKIAAFVDTPVYADISEKYAPRKVIKTGEPINVVANVARKQWGVVAEGGNVVGYVPLRYLDKSIAKKASNSFAKAAPPVKAPKTVVAGSDKTNAAASAAAAPQPVAATVQVARVCKVIAVKHDPVGGGAPLSDERKYCSDPPPKWRLVSA